MSVYKYPQLHDEAWFRHQYETLRKTAAEIAAEVGCGKSTVDSAMSEHGVKGRRDHRKGTRGAPRYNPRTCRTCGVVFAPTGPVQRFCVECW